jgi:hypothetical protein
LNNRASFFGEDFCGTYTTADLAFAVMVWLYLTLVAYFIFFNSVLVFILADSPISSEKML